MANPRGQQRDKPFRDALRMEIADAGEDFKALRPIAAALIHKASEGDIPAIKELADRLDGKVPQAIVGDDDHGPIQHLITWKSSSTKLTTAPADSSSPSTIEPNALLVLSATEGQEKP